MSRTPNHGKATAQGPAPRDPDCLRYLTGIPYYDTAQSVGAIDSCYGDASSGIAVTPSCAGSAVTPPTGLALTKPANHQVNAAWNAVAGAGSYKAFRKSGDCSSIDIFVAVAVITATPWNSDLQCFGGLVTGSTS